MEVLFINKEFKNLDQQIELLKNRGLTISNETRAKQYLLTNNYYNLINGYSKYFQISTDKYISGSCFDEITYTNFYDQQIKHYTFKAVLEAENHIKSITAYLFAKDYSDLRYAYLDINCYDSSKTVAAIKTISKFYEKINYYSNKRQPNNSIKHYVEHYDNVPIWVIIDYLTLGELRYFIKNLPRSLREKIAKEMRTFISDHITNVQEPFTIEVFDSFLASINELRNTCAHDKKLIGFSQKSDIKYFKLLHKKYNIEPSNTRRSFYQTFLILQCFTSKIEFNKLHNSILKSLKNLNKKIHSIEFNILLNELGFPNNWHLTEQKLPQLQQKKITPGT
ncbi:CAAX protease [Aerococcus christensenii]|uniref:CAAX protease n=1 Tax=Aerococcus christensenii TaxID=87541 RepID=A0A2I1K7I1_9LACT|nr:CAAX protease [Aerococcus christensenii]